MSILFALILLMLIVPISILAERYQEKQNIKYEEYLVKLEAVKERKHARLGTFKKGKNKDGFDTVEIDL